MPRTGLVALEADEVPERGAVSLPEPLQIPSHFFRGDFPLVRLGPEGTREEERPLRFERLKLCAECPQVPPRAETARTTTTTHGEDHIDSEP